MLGGLNFQNIIATLFILSAIALLLFSAYILVLWSWRGGGGILFAGLGLVISTPGFIVFLLILTIGLVTIAGIIKPEKNYDNLSETRKKFEYPNDIFGGCGNETLDLSVVKNPNKYNEKTDRHLDTCIDYADLEAIWDAALESRISD